LQAFAGGSTERDLNTSMLSNKNMEKVPVEELIVTSKLYLQWKGIRSTSIEGSLIPFYFLGL